MVPIWQARILTSYDLYILLTDWFARKNLDNTVKFVTIFITGTNQVRSITYNTVGIRKTGHSNTRNIRKPDILTSGIQMV